MTAAALYKNLKGRFPDKVLLFKKGDFYRVYGEDAHTVRMLTGLPFKGFSGSWQRPAETFVLIPAEDAERYLSALLDGGCKIVLCEDNRTEEILKQENLPGIPAPGVGTNQLEPIARQEELFG